MPPSGDGNGFGERYAEDFALYAQHGLTHHRLSIEWARIEPEEGRRDDARGRALPRGAHRGAVDAGVVAVGLPAPLHAAGLVHRDRRRRLRRRPRPLVLLGAPRRVLRGDVRRPRVRVEADQRAGRVRGHLPARPEAVRHARRDVARAARRVARAARRRQAGRDDPQPLAGLHRRRHDPRRPDAGAARRDDVGRVDARRSRRRARAAGPGVASRCPTCARRATSSASRTTARPASTPRADRSVSRRRRGSGRWVTRRGAKASALVLHRLHEELPGPAVADLRARRRHRRRRVALRRAARVAARSSSARSPTASTCAASSTGPASTTTSGTAASTCSSGASRAIVSRVGARSC